MALGHPTSEVPQDGVSELTLTEPPSWPYPHLSAVQGCPGRPRELRGPFFPSSGAATGEKGHATADARSPPAATQ